MVGVWKSLAIQYLDDSGEVVRMEKAEENPCLDQSRWLFAEHHFSFYTILGTANCRPDDEKTTGIWGKIENSYFFFYMPGASPVEEVDIIHVSRDRLILKLHGTSIYDDPGIMIFEKVGEDFDPIIISS